MIDSAQFVARQRDLERWLHPDSDCRHAVALCDCDPGFAMDLSLS
jgi:hypothetical protein